MTNSEVPQAAFPRRARRGVVGRFDWPQIAAFGFVGLVILSCVFRHDPLQAMIAAAPLWLAGLGLAVIEIQDIPVLSWIGWSGVFVFRRLMGQTEFHRPLGTPTVEGIMSLPGGAGRLRLLDHAGHGFTVDPKRQTFTAVMAVESPSYKLSDSARKVSAAENWGSILAQLHTHDGLVAVQVILTTTATSPTAIFDYAQNRGLADAPEWTRTTYGQLVEEITTNALEHRAYIAVSLSSGQLRRQISQAGGGRTGMARLLETEVQAWTTALRDGDIGEATWLSARQIAQIVRESFDPTAAVEIAKRRDEKPGVPVRQAGPMGVKILADRIETDGVCASTWEISEWPRVPATPEFLTSVIALDANHTVSLTYHPMSNRETTKRMNATLSDIDAERIQANKGGGEKATKTFFRNIEEQAVKQRMQEFGEGHSDLEFVGTITVYGADRDGLLAAEQALKNAAGRSRLECRRMWLRQDSGFAMTTLPFGLGIRNA